MIHALMITLRLKLDFLGTGVFSECKIGCDLGSNPSVCVLGLQLATQDYVVSHKSFQVKYYGSCHSFRKEITPKLNMGDRLHQFCVLKT